MYVRWMKLGEDQAKKHAEQSDWDDRMPQKKLSTRVIH